MELKEVDVVKNRLKIIRLKHGLSQKELGDLVGMKQSMVNRIENQLGNLTIANAIKISNVLGEPLDSLWENGYLSVETKKFDFLNMLSDWQIIELKEALECEIKLREKKREEA